ncbi:hypothetical protein [Verrucomicrobium sp. BvORR106]|uniref:hypothetical protein n=1 Tax=Verrucomicrobium sp. BvORR106 TaxID=1403819 RepID=UPI0005717ABF|nr:hypothetical protein [Verrucomicrobium sp. BvORR106]
MDRSNGESCLKEISKLSWTDWTPETAEWVRQRFLGRFSSNPHWKDLSLELITRGIVTVRTLTPEEEALRREALKYCEKVKQEQPPKPKAPSWLAGKGYPPELLKLTWREWTPQIAEMVREHFLWPLRENPNWNYMGLEGIARNISSLRKLTEEEWYLVEEALSYSAYWDQMRSQKSSSTVEVKETT